MKKMGEQNIKYDKYVEKIQDKVYEKNVGKNEEKK